MTLKQKKEYIRTGGNHCPFCKSKNINAGPIKYGDPLLAECYCTECEKQWRDIYTLTEVFESEE